MPALSPRTMAFSGGPPSADQARPLFEQGLTQMAYDVLISKLPNLSQDVVTFKIINVDPEAGSGVGAFVVRRQGQSLYIPVVMADNQIKPLDIFYHKGLNVFLPLSKEWLEQIDRASLSELGEGRKPPRSLSKDVDIRQVVVPPVTGRFSYASDMSDTKTAAAVFDQARVTQAAGRPAFLEFLSLAPNNVKKAAALVFEQNPKVLKAAVRTYGARKLATAMHEMPEKVADYGGRLSRGGALYVLDSNTPADVFKGLFGPQAPLAYQDAVSRGYAGFDSRKTNRAIKTTQPMVWTEPDAPGAYKFVGLDGKPVMALAFPATIELFTRFKYDTRGSSARRGYDKPRFENGCAVTEDGDCVRGKLPVAEKLHLGQLKGSRLLREIASGTPRVGAHGIFVRLDSRGLSATEPVTVKRVSTDSAGARRVVVTQYPHGYEERELITLPDTEHTPLVLPNKERVGQLPSSFSFVTIKDNESAGDLFVSDNRAIQRMVSDALYKSAGEKHTVRFSDAHGWTIDAGNRHGLKFASAIEAVARHAKVHVDVAATLVKEAAETGRVEFWSVPETGARRVENFLKLAAGEPQAAPPQDPNQMPPAPPPMPTPVDMAVAEQTQSIMGQMQALQQQLNLLQMVQQRSQQIAGVGPAGAPEAMAAAMGGPSPLGPQGVNPALAGPGPQMGPQDPAAMQQGQMGPQQPQGQMGMPPDPMAMQQQGQMGMPPGGDPNQPQIDPQTGQPMEPPPPAMMSNEPSTPEEIAAQVNPQFMEQAGQLQDEGAFDAAALASMAQSPSVRDLVAAYVPNLERALDNLGRIMITLYMDEARIKDQVGNETFVALEDNLRNTFKGLGDLLLKINQNAVTMQTTSPFVNNI